jgi:glutathione S-transferase
MADIHLYGWLDFAGTVGQPLDRGNTHIAAWFDRVAQRPSTKA